MAVRRLLALAICMGLAWSAATAATSGASRASGGNHTPERLANARQTVARFAWAKAERDAAVAKAAKWLAKDDAALWKLIPGQELPRCIDVTMTYTPNGQIRMGCLVCGDAIDPYGNYPWIVNVDTRPWKVQCPNCKTVFPTNDFGKFYASGIDEHGLFDFERADRSLLFNAEHPDPADPKHMWGVDDGYGYDDGNGYDHRFVAYYGWQYWRYIQTAVIELANAYMYTGDKVYTRKAGLLLDRLADVYPSMDWNKYAVLGWYHSDGGSKKGKIEGRIWENATFNSYATAYDQIYTGLADNLDLYRFLAQMSRDYQLPGAKGSREALVDNIDNGLLRTGAAAIKSGQIQGNVGMHHSAMVAAALALNTEPETSQWLDWLFEPAGGGLPGIVIGRIDRDGIGDEASPGYSLGWISNLSTTANRIAGYPAYTKWSLYRDFPRFKHGFLVPWRLPVLDIATPNIGDVGQTGKLGIVKAPDADAVAEAFRATGDERLALAAWWSNGYKATGLGRSVLDAEPDALAQAIEAVVNKASTNASRPPAPHLMAAYGLARLETGYQKSGTGFSLYFGRNAGHGHRDRLNYSLYAFGYELTPDLGYPEFASNWPHRNEWSINTISHNTVVIDRQGQSTNWGGTLVFYKTLPGVQAVEISSPNVYAQASEYRRMLAMIETAPGLAYGIDIFRVAGGGEHTLSFHGQSVEVATAGLSLVAQGGGTLAGPTVPYGDAPKGVSGFPMGYSWLTEVAKAGSPAAGWSADWKLPKGYYGSTGNEGIHVRMWNLTEAAQEVALANGQPPRNKTGNPEWLRWALTTRKGTALKSTFVSVIEPYKQTPQVASVRRVALEGVDVQDGPVVLEIELTDGAVDTLMYNPPQGAGLNAGGRELDGRLGFIRRRGGKVERAALIGGSTMRDGPFELKAPQGAWSGKVLALSDAASTRSLVTVDATLPIDGSLVGQWIAIANDGVRNAFYKIEGVAREGAGSLIDLGDVSLVRSYKSNSDYSKGVVMNFAPDAAFTIATDATYDSAVRSAAAPGWGRAE